MVKEIFNDEMKKLNGRLQIKMVTGMQTLLTV